MAQKVSLLLLLLLMECHFLIGINSVKVTSDTILIKEEMGWGRYSIDKVLTLTDRRLTHTKIKTTSFTDTKKCHFKEVLLLYRREPRTKY